MMSEVSEVLFERVRRTMKQKDILTCQLGKCLLGECSITECPVEDWIAELRGKTESIDKKTLTLEAVVFHALSDPTRLRIIKLLAMQGRLCACEIQAAIGESQSLTSYHMGLLKKAGIVKAEKHGVWAYYRLSSPMVISIISVADKIATRSKVMQNHAQRT